jgi:hypothetical protein
MMPTCVRNVFKVFASTATSFNPLPFAISSQAGHGNAAWHCSIVRSPALLRFARSRLCDHASAPKSLRLSRRQLPNQSS